MTKTVELSPATSKIALHVNGLNIPVKDRVVRMNLENNNQDPTTCCLQDTYFKYKNSDRLNVKDRGRNTTITPMKKKLEYIHYFQI